METDILRSHTLTSEPFSMYCRVGQKSTPSRRRAFSGIMRRFAAPSSAAAASSSSSSSSSSSAVQQHARPNPAVRSSSGGTLDVVLSSTNHNPPPFTMPPPRSAPSSPGRGLQKHEAYHEVFRYKVVYPGGTFVRISPGLDADKTGQILDFGTVFEASKSLFLDGTNFAKLANGAGWVFDSKNGIEILELLEVVRIPFRAQRARSVDPGGGGGGSVSGSVGKGERDDDSVASLQPSTAYRRPLGGTPSPLTGSTMAMRKGTAAGGERGAPLAATAAHSFRAVPPPPPGLSRGGTGGYTLPLQYHPSGPAAGSSSSASSVNSGSFVRSENRIWRDVRARCGQCATFAEFQQLAAAVEKQYHQHAQPAYHQQYQHQYQHHHNNHHYHHQQQLPADARARLAWSATAAASAAAGGGGDRALTHHDLQVRGCVALITSITRHCSGDVAEQAGMEACLWVLVHMGSRVAHVMALIVEAANARFEALPAARQSELLRVVLEVGARTKVCLAGGGGEGDRLE